VTTVIHSFSSTLDESIRGQWDSFLVAVQALRSQSDAIDEIAKKSLMLPFQSLISPYTNASLSINHFHPPTTTKLTPHPALGPHIAVLKTHIDILSDLTPTTLTRLAALSHKHNFLIFEDRKFIDIGATVQKQYHGGALRISEWAHIVNCSVLAGPGIVEALAQTAESSGMQSFVKEADAAGGVQGEKVGTGRGMLILAEMTSKGSLATGAYTAASVAIARQFPGFVIGFVATRGLGDVVVEEEKYAAPSSEEDFLIFTTGVNMSSTGDALGQQYNTPRKAVLGGADFIISGRGIYKAGDGSPKQVEEAALRYKKEGWETYLERTGQQ